MRTQHHLPISDTCHQFYMKHMKPSKHVISIKVKGSLVVNLDVNAKEWALGKVINKIMFFKQGHYEEYHNSRGVSGW